MSITIREQMVNNIINIKRDLYGMRNMTINPNVIPETFRQKLLDQLAQTHNLLDEIQQTIERIGA